MTKKKTDVSEYCTASEAAQILARKLGRPVRPDYIHRVQGISSIPLNKTTWLYLRSDVENATIQQHMRASGTDRGARLGHESLAETGTLSAQAQTRRESPR